MSDSEENVTMTQPQAGPPGYTPATPQVSANNVNYIWILIQHQFLLFIKGLI